MRVDGGAKYRSATRIFIMNYSGENVFRNIFLFPMAISFIVTGMKSFSEINLVSKWNLPHSVNIGGFFLALIHGHFGQAVDRLLPSFYKAWVVNPVIGVIGLRQKFIPSFSRRT